MGADTRIEWADHTFNPWTGCQAVSPACDHCYAEAQAKRAPQTFGGWGPHAERKRTGESYWRKPLLWNKRAEKAGTRPRVFCASMADVFDNQVPEEWRRDLWLLIRDTPQLDWLLLTKRPQNIAKMLPGPSAGWSDTLSRTLWGRGWSNVWLGTTVENQAEADRRIPHLLAVPAAKRFLSCEPLLGPADLTGLPWVPSWPRCDCQHHSPRLDVLNGTVMCEGCCEGAEALDGARIDWIIAGGESGPKARPSHPDWFRSLRDQCQAAGVPFFFKQWGEWSHARVARSETPGRYALTPRTWPGPIVPIDHFPRQFTSFGSTVLERVGKRAAGTALDGREWREVPGA